MVTLQRSLLLVSSLTACLVSFQLAAQSYSVPDNTPAHIRRGVESNARTAEQVARDAGRKPAEVLTLADLNEGDHVAEITTFGQYYTPMLVAAVGPTGKVEMYDLPGLAAFQEGAVGEAGQAFADANGNAEYHVVDYNEIDLPQGLDAIFNILFYHDHQGMGVDSASLNASAFDALKPGGKYVIVDHLAAAGAGTSQTGTIHRIEKSVIINEVTAAGFDLIVDSDILANPDDDHTAGVFSMRGETDRALLVFQKSL